MNTPMATPHCRDGQEVDVAVIDFTHREALSQPFELTLNLASRDGSLDAADLLGTPTAAIGRRA